MSAILDNTTQPTFHELDHRETNGIEVSLLWNTRDGSVSIYVYDTRTGGSREALVPCDCAREAFLHLFAFIPKDDR
jgi:hypothetical protein